MTKLIKIKGRERKVIDLTPAENITSKLELAVTKRKTWKDRSHIPVETQLLEECEKLNEDQKDYLLWYFIGEYIHAYDLYLSALDNSGKIEEYKKILNAKDVRDLIIQQT
ncbi:hypothetical protein J4411_00055 [Candidatus Pacearchaeota archaeon]|nr:hypothetical protein [Candidatus Pacearchaeota archaeon]